MMLKNTAASDYGITMHVTKCSNKGWRNDPGRIMDVRAFANPHSGTDFAAVRRDVRLASERIQGESAKALRRVKQIQISAGDVTDGRNAPIAQLATQ
jgi:hypothetical protein